MLDGQCIYALENRGDFGKVRLFGSMGYGILAYLTGLVVNMGSSKKERYLYIDTFFYIFSGISMASAIYWYIGHRYIPTIAPDTAR